MSKQILTQERLRELLNYDQETGLFTWRVWKGARAPVGGVAGSRDSSGHIQILIDKHPYRAHRLAWLHVHGEWPKDQIDHINGVRTDNRLSNLRDVPHLINSQNKRATHNASGSMVGVRRRIRNGRWEARLTIAGKLTILGAYDTPDEARAAYVEAKRVHHQGCTI